MSALGSWIGQIRNKNADRHFYGTIINPSFKVADDPADRQSNRDSTGGEPDKGEQAAGSGRGTFLNQDADGEFKRQQPRSIVNEALSFEDVDDTAGKSDTPCD